MSSTLKILLAGERKREALLLLPIALSSSQTTRPKQN